MLYPNFLERNKNWEPRAREQLMYMKYLVGRVNYGGAKLAYTRSLCLKSGLNGQEYTELTPFCPNREGVRRRKMFPVGNIPRAYCHYTRGEEVFQALP